jgi:two-component system response regulator RegA
MNAHDGEFGPHSRLLLVDASVRFSRHLSSALEKRGFGVTVCHTAEEAFRSIMDDLPGYVVTDVKLPDLSGLALVSTLKKTAPHVSIVVLTAYGSIATAVEAIKLGATNYLTKPANVDQILAAFSRHNGDDRVPVRAKPLSINRLEWEYINWVLMEHAGNLSAAARALSMHRRTLQRKLFKRAEVN